jgi:hypothetical protein
MSRDDLGRDPVVTRALATIPVPDHAPDFWDRLDVALRAQDPEPEAEAETPDPLVAPEADAEAEMDAAAEAEAPDAAAEAPELVVVPATAASVFADDTAPGAAPGTGAEPVVADVELDAAPVTVPAARRWGGRVARALVAAAAVVAVAVVGVLVARRDDTGPDLSDRTVPTVDGGTGTTTAPPDVTPADETPQGRAVVGFVDALGRGDIDAAAALLGPRSDAFLVAQSGSVDAFLREATEGLGAWSASPDRTVSLIEDAGGASVVVLEGTVSPEGMTEHRRWAVPVVHAESADAWFVDPWAFDPGIEDQRFDYTPAPGPGQPLVLHPGDEFEVTIPVAGGFWAYLDGRLVGDESSSSSAESASGEVSVSSSIAGTIPDDARDGATLVIVFASDSGTTYLAEAIAANSS